MADYFVDTNVFLRYVDVGLDVGYTSYRLRYGNTDSRETLVKTVQMTLDEELVEAVDRAAKRLGTSRSAFARRALRQALARLREQELERKHRRGYERRPVKPEEFALWEPEQVWPD